MDQTNGANTDYLITCPYAKTAKYTAILLRHLEACFFYSQFLGKGNDFWSVVRTAQKQFSGHAAIALDRRGIGLYYQAFLTWVHTRGYQARGL
jgi:hypothetical protein